MNHVNSEIRSYSDPAAVVDEAKRDLQAASQLLHQSQIYDDLRALESPATLSAQSSVTELSLIHNLAQARNNAEARATHEPVERSLLVVAGGVTDDVALRIFTIQRVLPRQTQEDEGTEDSASTSVQFDVNIRVLTPDVDYTDSHFEVSRPFGTTYEDVRVDQRGNRVEIIRALSPVSVISSDLDVESSTASFYTACQTIKSSSTNRRDASNHAVQLPVTLDQQLAKTAVDEHDTATTVTDEFYTLSDGDSTATPISDVDENDSEFRADQLLQAVLKDASDAFCDALPAANQHDDDTVQLSSEDELEPPEIDDPQLAVTRADILQARHAQLRRDVQLVHDDDVIDESLLEIDREIERKLRQAEKTPTSSCGELKLADDGTSASASASTAGDEDSDSEYVLGGALPQRTVRSPPPEVDETGDSASDLTPTVARKPKTLGLPLVRVPIAHRPPMSSISECDDESTSTSITNAEWTIEPTLVSSLQALTAFDSHEHEHEELERPPEPPRRRAVSFPMRDVQCDKPLPSPPANDADLLEESGAESGGEIELESETDVSDWHKQYHPSSHAQVDTEQAEEGYVEDEEENVNGDDGSVTEYENEEVIQQERRKLELDNADADGEEQLESESEAYHEYANFDAIQEFVRSNAHNDEVVYENGATDEDEEELDQEQSDEGQLDDEEQLEEEAEEQEEEGHVEEEEQEQEQVEEEQEEEEEQLEEDGYEDEHEQETGYNGENEGLELQNESEEIEEEVQEQEDDETQETHEEEQEDENVFEVQEEQDEEENQADHDEQQVTDLSTDAHPLANDAAEDAQELQQYEAEAEADVHQPIEQVAPIQTTTQFQNAKVKNQTRVSTTRKRSSAQSSSEKRYLPTKRYEKPLPTTPSTADVELAFEAKADDWTAVVGHGTSDSQSDMANAEADEPDEPPPPVPRDYCNVTPVQMEHLSAAAWFSTSADLLRVECANAPICHLPVRAPIATNETAEESLTTRHRPVPISHSVSSDFVEMQYANAAIFELPLCSSPLTALRRNEELQLAIKLDEYQPPASFTELDQPAEKMSSIKTKKKKTKINRTNVANSWNSLPVNFVEVHFANAPIGHLPVRVLPFAGSLNTEESVPLTRSNELKSITDATDRNRKKKKKITKKVRNIAEPVLIEMQASAPTDGLHVSPQLQSLPAEVTVTVGGSHLINPVQHSTANVPLLGLTLNEGDSNGSVTQAPEVLTATELHFQAEHAHPVDSVSTDTNFDSPDQLDDTAEGSRVVEHCLVNTVVATHVQLLGHSTSPTGLPETDRTNEFDFFDVLHAGNMSYGPLSRALSQSTESLFIEMQPFVDGDLHCLSVLIGKKLASFKRLLTEPASLGRHGRVLAACLSDLLCHGTADHEAFLDSLLHRHALLTCLLVGQLESLCTTVSHSEVLADSDHARRDALCAATLGRLTNEPNSVACCSKFARVGSNLYGCGVLLFVFLSERAAQHFVQSSSDANRAPIDSMTDADTDGHAQLCDAGPFVVYLSVKHTKTYLTRAVGRQLDALADLCSSYDVDTQYVCAVLLLDRTASSDGDVTWRGAIAWRVADTCIRPTNCRASDRSTEKQNGHADSFATTPVSLATDEDSDKDEGEDEVERRKAFVRDVQLALRQYDVSLRHSFPEVHVRLVKFVATGKPFVPTIVRFTAKRNSALNASSTGSDENAAAAQCEYACAISCEKLPVVRIAQPSATQRKAQAKNKPSALLFDNANLVNGMPTSHSSGADVQTARVTDL